MFKLLDLMSEIIGIGKLKTIMNRKKYRNLEKEAFSTFASELVLEEVRKNTGINQTQITDGAFTQYEYLLESKLEVIRKQFANSKWSNSKVFAKKIAKKDPSVIFDEFAKAKYGMIFKKLPSYKQENIKILLQDSELMQVIKDVNLNKRFQSAYVNIYNDLSARGVDLRSRKKKFIMSIKQAQKNFCKKRKNRCIDQGSIINEFMCLKYYDFNKQEESQNTEFLQGAKYKIILSPKAQNYRKLTHFEIIKNQEINNIYKRVREIIDRNDQQYKAKTTLSDFLGKMSEQENTMYATFKEIEKKELFHLVRIALSVGQNPVLLGNTYMQQHATDSEMKNLIDQAMIVEEDFVSQDQSIKLFEKHTLIQETTAKNIIDGYNYISQIYKIENVNIYKLLDMLEKHYLRESKVKKSEKYKKIEDFINSIENFFTSEKILEQIVERRKNIRDEILYHIDAINDYRENSGFKKYTPKQKKLPVYNILKIENILSS